MDRLSAGELKRLGWQVRRDVLIMLEHAGSGHPGGSLSAVEILTSLYYNKLRHDPRNPNWEARDRFVLSKGHCCPVLYTVLAYRGFFPKEELMTFRRLGSRLQGHTYRGVPGVEVSTGSLGQGLSVANGMAIAAKHGKKDSRVYCLIGDGEMDEGQIWEAAMTASFRKLDNLCCIVDKNQVQQNGLTRVIKDLDPVPDKWRACGWHVIEVDGHDAVQVTKAYDEAETVKSKPSVVIANTIKGKGVSFMELNHQWHGKTPNKTELEAALKELDAAMGVK
ncbi:MAG: transketolase [Chloroflexi bacterium]|nr:transketolase [Chloroflexota bacterium]